MGEKPLFKTASFPPFTFFLPAVLILPPYTLSFSGRRHATGNVTLPSFSFRWSLEWSNRQHLDVLCMSSKLRNKTFVIDHWKKILSHGVAPILFSKLKRQSNNDTHTKNPPMSWSRHSTLASSAHRKRLFLLEVICCVAWTYSIITFQRHEKWLLCAFRGDHAITYYSWG